MSSGVLLYYFLSFFLLSSLWWIVVVSHWTASSNILFFFSFQIRRLIMAKTTEGNEEKMKTPSQDGQGHFDPSLPSTEALIRFWEKHVYHGKIGTLTIHHILRMARLILDTNCFAYIDTYYRQVRGGAMGSAFTQVLANIYMLEWEQDLIRYQTEHGEIYGRFDDIYANLSFFHWFLSASI